MGRKKNPHEKLQLPSLPSEILIKILSHNTNLVHLWFDCREVSTTFRACAEAAITQYVLPNAGVSISYLNAANKQVKFPLRFDLLDPSDDNRMMVFSDSSIDTHIVSVPTWKLLDGDSTCRLYAYIFEFKCLPEDSSHRQFGEDGLYHMCDFHINEADFTNGELRLAWAKLMTDIITSQVYRAFYAGAVQKSGSSLYGKDISQLLQCRRRLRRIGRLPIVKTGSYRRGLRRSTRIAKLVKVQ